jgi:hypothetical protein
MVPPGLKPAIIGLRNGRAEARPFQCVDDGCAQRLIYTCQQAPARRSGVSAEQETMPERAQNSQGKRGLSNRAV